MGSVGEPQVLERPRPGGRAREGERRGHDVVRAGPEVASVAGTILLQALNAGNPVGAGGEGDGGEGGIRTRGGY